jgi:hypothetical protein
VIETGSGESRGVVAGIARPAGRNMIGRHDRGRRALTAAGMAARALGRGSLEYTLGMARFTPLIPVSTVQLKTCPGMVKPPTGRTGSENRRGKHTHQAYPNEDPCKP